MDKEFNAFFKGKNTILPARCKIEDDHLFILKENKLFPFLSKWVIGIYNAKEYIKDYNKLIVLDMEKGYTKTEILEFPIDFFTKQKDYSKVDTEAHLELESLREERDFLHQRMLELETFIEEQGVFDLYMSRFRKHHNQITNLKSGYNANKEEDKKKK